MLIQTAIVFMSLSGQHALTCLYACPEATPAAWLQEFYHICAPDRGCIYRNVALIHWQAWLGILECEVESEDRWTLGIANPTEIPESDMGSRSRVYPS